MKSPESVVSDFIRAVETKHFDVALSLVTEDVSYENMPIAPIIGKDAMRKTLEGFLGAASEVEWPVLRQITSGNLVINERLDRFKIGNGWLELPIVGIFEVNDDGLIRLWRDYFDMATYTRQFSALTSGS